MKPIYLDLSGARALGDAICSTPTIKKLYDSYGQKINVFSQYPELFRKNPYVDKNFHSKDIQVDYVKENFIYHNSFHNIGQKNQWDVEMKHNNMDIRQFHAIMLGFMLSPNEMTCEYYPETFEPIDGLPEKYVLIHPVQTWPSRTWLAENWMKLTKLLNDRGISVVSIGKDSSEVGFFNVDKPIFNFEIHDGLNLMNNTSISQAWHLINKSIAFVTMDSGLLHLAGTTDSEIIMLGSSLKPEFRLPYRNGSQIYKQYYVSGGCQLACGSNMKHGVKEWGDIQGIPPLIGCLENKLSFECHPRVETVLHKIENIIENVR
jgi:ADP-heptose:LPS heptosyltransferase